MSPWHTMRSLTLVIAVFFATGCSTAAKIYLKDGRVIWGEIKQSDPHSIYVKSKDSDRVTAVFRHSIDEIDHPGNGPAVVGTLFGLAGFAYACFGIAHEVHCEGIECGFGYMFAILPGLLVAIPSTIASIWGWTTWAESRSAASFESPKIAPLAMSDGEKTYYGIGMSWRW